MPGTWHIDANGLLSTITFLAAHPEVATDATPAQFEAMIASPPGVRHSSR